jgi:hypothetical protein
VAHTLQELRSIHSGHLHIGNNDCKGTVSTEQYQALFAAGSGCNIKLAFQHLPIASQRRWITVHQQYLLIHETGLFLHHSL